MKVLVSDPLSQKGLEILEQAKGVKIDLKPGLTPEELKKIIAEYDAIIIRSETKLKADIIEAGNRLKVIGRAGIGLDNIDLPAATKKGIVVMNTPQENAIAAAEHTIAMMFSISRKVPQAAASIKTGKWEKKKFMGVELYNKTLGLVGIGVIGTIVADRARGLKMKVIGYDPYLSPEAAEKKGVELVSFDELLGRSDFISVHTPLTDETRNLIDQNALAKTKKGVILINCARGGIINEKDLYEAIRAGKVAGAALDVFEKEPAIGNPLLELEEVIGTPHLGASTEEAQENVAIAISRQIVDYLVHGEARNAVNMPAVSPDILPFLRPYLRLGEKLGSFLGQISNYAIEEVLIEYHGEIVEYGTKAITTSVLKGLLTPFVGETVNFVNAPIMAKERGIRVTESISEISEDFASLIALTVRSKMEQNYIAGTLFGRKELRIVKLNDFFIEALPEGYILLVNNYDRAGVIGNIGMALGSRNINIATMQFGRDRMGGMAMSLLHLDSPLPAGMLGEILRLPNIISVRQIEL
ncbi:MAG: phosphoglycerate dehydrogenase [Deltaproteobacteria bacterium RBG_16_49_23]|nr:MAG: phosphoglycerate dehydrogenase [Deltaproteobacteria bacterium RBG_16_49_23]